MARELKNFCIIGTKVATQILKDGDKVEDDSNKGIIKKTMIDPNKKQFRWGPIPGRLLTISHWIALYYWYPKRLHHYIWPESYLILYKQRMLYMCEKKKLEIVGGRVFRETILTGKINRIWKVWQQYLFNLLSFCKRIDKYYLKSLSDGELMKNWQDFNRLVYLFWEPGVVPELGAYGAEPILREILEKEELDENEKIKALSILSAPTKLSFYQEEEIDLLKLLKKYRAKKFNVLLKKHQQKYFWLENSYFRTKVLGDDFFLEKIKEKIKAGIESQRVIKEMYHLLEVTKQKKLKILAKLRNKKQIKKISDGLCHCIWWQDHRKKYIFQYLHYLDLFVSEFARRARISSRIFDFAWPEEASTQPSKRLIDFWKIRKKDYFVVHFLKNKKKYIYGKKARKIYKTFWFEKVEIQKDWLKGLVVYTSDKKITGEVHIIKTASDIKKFPQGKILITTMTAPEYITAIRKAKAIVTDTGGMTCHAAIVSRELKVPCIVGTKVATKVFKNGDLVEVDANKGIVRRL